MNKAYHSKFIMLKEKDAVRELEAAKIKKENDHTEAIFREYRN